MPRNLLDLLSDGQIHSGESLGLKLGLSRAAIWKQVQKLLDYGIFVASIRGQGYQLAEPLSLLDSKVITDSLDLDTASLLSQLDIKWSIASTNTVCLDLISSNRATTGYVCLAEHQFAGRGRRGRKWVSPLAGNIYMSVIWKFAGGVESIEGLSLAVGVCVADVLCEKLQLPQIRLKWPNDILCSHRKLGGILIEVTGDATGPCHAVIGLGLNVNLLVSHLQTEVDQPYTDLYKETGHRLICRNSIAVWFLNKLLPMLQGFECNGIKAYAKQWNSYDAFYNQPVVVQQGGEQYFVGEAKGVTDAGALVVSADGNIRQFRSGEVSLRRV